MDTANKKPYIICIQEHYHKGVVVWAEDENAAASIANSLCDSGEIDLERNCYVGRDVDIQGTASKDTLKDFDEYDV